MPWEQRPVNELAQLRESWLFSWVRRCNLLSQRGHSSGDQSSKRANAAGELLALYPVHGCALLQPPPQAHQCLNADRLRCAQATLSLPEYTKRARRPL